MFSDAATFFKETAGLRHTDGLETVDLTWLCVKGPGETVGPCGTEDLERNSELLDLEYGSEILDLEHDSELLDLEQESGDLWLPFNTSAYDLEGAGTSLETEERLESEALALDLLTLGM